MGQTAAVGEFVRLC